MKRVHPKKTSKNVLTAGELSIDLEGYDVHVKGEKIERIPKKVEILAFPFYGKKGMK